MFEKPEHPKAIGEVAEAITVAKLLSMGYRVSKPLGDNCPYDLVVEAADRLYKVQVKTGRLVGAVIECNLVRRRLNAQQAYKRPYSLNEVDYFLFFCFEVGRVYLLPNTANLPERVYLRLEPSRNNQKKKLRMAQDLELGKVRI